MGYYDGYSYETTVSGGDAVGITILLIYLIVLLVWGLVSLAGYILKGIGMYTIAKRRGMDYPWLAYVPFARAYLQGELGGEIVTVGADAHKPEHVAYAFDQAGDILRMCGFRYYAEFENRTPVFHALV